jgi:hypothetical protein
MACLRRMCSGGFRNGFLSELAKWLNDVSSQNYNVHYREKVRQLHWFYLSYYTNLNIEPTSDTDGLLFTCMCNTESFPEGRTHTSFLIMMNYFKSLSQNQNNIAPVPVLRIDTLTHMEPSFIRRRKKFWAENTGALSTENALSLPVWKCRSWSWLPGYLWQNLILHHYFSHTYHAENPAIQMYISPTWNRFLNALAEHKHKGNWYIL